MTNTLLLVLSLAFTSFSAHAELSLGQRIPALVGEKAEGGSFDLIKDTKSKTVVFEWLNFECPFVRKHYIDSKNMQETQAWAKEKGVLWISVASSGKNKKGKGKEGYMEASELLAKKKELGSNADFIIRDVSGQIGRAFGAKTTPHLFIFNTEGKLAYQGAIDSEASADADDIKMATNFVKEAVTKLSEGRNYTKQTEAYGCGVKYGD